MNLATSSVDYEFRSICGYGENLPTPGGRTVLPAESSIREPEQFMDSRVKALIFCGGKHNGHRSPALAIQSALGASPNIDVSFRGTELSNGGNDSTLGRIKKAAKWHLRNSDALWSVYTYPKERRARIKLVAETQKAIDDVQPDVVITAHHWSGQFLHEAIDNLKRDIPLIRVVTDFDRVNREWFDMHPGPNDVWAFPNESGRRYAVRRGLPEANTVVTGYAVRVGFAQPNNDISAQTLRQELRLPINRSVTLIMAGSDGTRKLEYMVAKMMSSKDFTDDKGRLPHIVVLAGKNQKFKASVEKIASNCLTDLRLPTISIFGFVSDVHKYMRASDVILTKSGGSTIAEILEVGKPYILFDRLSPTEEGNIRHTRAAKTGIVALKGVHAALIAWKKVLTSPVTCETMVTAQLSTTRGGAENIADLVRTLAIKRLLTNR